MPNVRMTLCTQSVHFFSFPPRPLRTAPSRFPNMISFGNCPPLIRRSVPAHKSLLVRNVVSMLSHPVISRARLYEVIRWSGLLRCAPMMRSKTRWCTVRSLVYTNIIHHVGIPKQNTKEHYCLSGMNLDFSNIFSILQ